MPRGKEKKEQIKPANTFIDKGVVIRAKRLSGSESVRIDGHFIGDIDLGGYLHVGETGRIEGNLHASYALISGEIQGDILCRSTVQLSPKARVFGNITSEYVIIDEGAVFHGFCETRKTDRPTEAEAVVL